MAKYKVIDTWKAPEVRIPLHGKNGEGKFALVDAENAEVILGNSWSVNKGYAMRGMYFHGSTKSFKMEWFIMGKPMPGYCIDHISGDRLDNRKSNLRVCTMAQNKTNRTKKDHNKHGYTGIFWHEIRKRFYARIKVAGKYVYIGSYRSKEEAARAYNKAARKYHGEFAKQNILKEVA